MSISFQTFSFRSLFFVLNEAAFSQRTELLHSNVKIRARKWHKEPCSTVDTAAGGGIDSDWGNDQF